MAGVESKTRGFISGTKVADTGDGYLRVERANTGAVEVVPKSDVKEIHGPVEDAKEQPKR